MKSFKGFNSNQDRGTLLPQEFFSVVLPRIDNLFELKVVIYIIWFQQNNELNYPYITADLLKKDALFLKGFGSNEHEQIKNIEKGISLAIEDQILFEIKEITPDIYILNSPAGREAVELIKAGSLTLEPAKEYPVQLTRIKPNIFQIYEENIGIITPVIADTLTEMENEYPIEWIEEAINEAVKNNVRKLRYIEVILRNWQEEGKYERTNRRRSQKNKEEYDPDKYIDGEFSDFIDH